MAQPVLKENEYEHTEWQRFSLFRENKDGTDRASLHWQLDYGNPRIVVNTSTNLKKEDGSFSHKCYFICIIASNKTFNHCSI